MNIRAGVVLAGVAALALVGSVSSAGAQDLSEHAVKSFMEYAWSLTPQQFSKPDGTVIVIDKTKKDQVLVPLDVARDVIKAEDIKDYTQRENFAERFAKRFGASLMTGFSSRAEAPAWR